MKVSHYNQMMGWLTGPRYSFYNGGRVGFDNGGLVQKDFIELYNKFSGGSDQEFAEFIKEQTGVELKPKTINERRRRANLKIKIKEGQSLRGTAPRLADNEVLTEAKKLGIDTKGKDIKKLRKLISSKRLVEKRRTDPVAKEKRNVAEREYKQKVKERRKVDPEFDLAQKEKIKNYPSRKNMYVEQRARLWGKKEKYYPHILVMTATPIPRTLALTLYGDLDVSVIDELPVGRKKIITSHRNENARLRVFGFIKKTIESGNQVYVVYPLIEESKKQDYKDLMDGYESFCRSFPKTAIGVLHGKMKPKDKDFEMKTTH